MTVEENPLDLVVEGRATEVRHEHALGRVAGAYASIYEWLSPRRAGGSAMPTASPGKGHGVSGLSTLG